MTHESGRGPVGTETSPTVRSARDTEPGITSRGRCSLAPTDASLVYACFTCGTPRLVLADFNNLLLCPKCSRGKLPQRFVRGEK